MTWLRSTVRVPRLRILYCINYFYLRKSRSLFVSSQFASDVVTPLWIERHRNVCMLSHLSDWAPGLTCINDMIYGRRYRYMGTKPKLSSSYMKRSKVLYKYETIKATWTGAMSWCNCHSSSTTRTGTIDTGVNLLISIPRDFSSASAC